MILGVWGRNKVVAFAVVFLELYGALNVAKVIFRLCNNGTFSALILLLSELSSSVCMNVS